MIYYGFKNKPFSNQKTRSILAVLIVINIFIFTVLFSKDNLGLIGQKLVPELRIDFVNVGCGNCCILRTPKGRTFIVDGGTKVSENEAKKTGRELLHNYLRKFNIRKIDGIVVSNWHTNNFTGLVPILKDYRIGVIYETPAGIKNDFYKDFEEICNRKRIKRITVKSGNVLEWGDEIFVQVLNPEEPFCSNIKSEMNNDSIVLMIRYGKVQTLLCSNIEEDAEREVIKFNDGLQSQIVLIPNYGSKDSLYKNFFKMVNAKDGIISINKNNMSGFPSEKSLDLFEELGIRIYRTDLNGNIHITVGGKNKEDYKITVDRNI